MRLIKTERKPQRTSLDVFGNISELILELAAVFAYENSKHCIDVFEETIKKMPLSKCVGETETIKRLQYDVYKFHISLNRPSAWTPLKLNEFLFKEMVQKFPKNLDFLKLFVDNRYKRLFFDWSFENGLSNLIQYHE